MVGQPPVLVAICANSTRQRSQAQRERLERERRAARPVASPRVKDQILQLVLRSGAPILDAARTTVSALGDERSFPRREDRFDLLRTNRVEVPRPAPAGEVGKLDGKGKNRGKVLDVPRGRGGARSECPERRAGGAGRLGASA